MHDPAVGRILAALVGHPPYQKWWHNDFYVGDIFNRRKFQNNLWIAKI